MLKLFAVLLGGRAHGCNTELHDVVFVIGESLKETYPRLVNKWFGHTKRLHIDSNVELKYIDGHEIVISKEPKVTDKKLFFVNFGAYKPDFFGEAHEINFYIAKSKPEVLARAKKELCVSSSLIEPHCDDNLIVDDIIAVEGIDGYYIHLVPTVFANELKILSKYCRLDLPEIIQEANALR